MTKIEHLSDSVTLHLGDCRDVLPTLARADAVVTDPPYGIGMAARGTIGTAKAAPVRDYGKADWDDEPPSPDTISALRKAAQWQIIFGGNFFDLPPSSCWLVWDKLNSADFADCELAWTNLPKAVRRLQLLWNGMIRAAGEPRGDHPTQKPIGLMKWAIRQLPDDAKTILDPFMGSGTTGVAAVQLGRRFVGIERVEAYFDISRRRISDALARPDLFAEKPARARPAEPPAELDLTTGRR